MFSCSKTQYNDTILYLIIIRVNSKAKAGLILFYKFLIRYFICNHLEVLANKKAFVTLNYLKCIFPTTPHMRSLLSLRSDDERRLAINDNKSIAIKYALKQIAWNAALYAGGYAFGHSNYGKQTIATTLAYIRTKRA